MKKYIVYINKKAKYLVFFAIFFGAYSTNAQAPKLYLKFAEKQNKVQSGYMKLKHINMIDDDADDASIEVEEVFFVTTPKDFIYLIYGHYPKYPHFSIVSCKLKHSKVEKRADSDTLTKRVNYIWYNDIPAQNTRKLYHLDAKDEILVDWDNFRFQRIAPKFNKKNVRYKILYPDQEDDMTTDISQEWEFDKKTFNWFQNTLSTTSFGTDRMYNSTEIMEQRIYDYIHPDIVDTISSVFETLKQGYDLQMATEQAKKDSAFRADICDSIDQIMANSIHLRIETIPQETTNTEDTLAFMPAWQFSSLAGDTIYSDSIKSRFLFIDMWYISCYPCRMAMIELATIDTLYDESLLKIVSINVSDKDATKIRKTVKNVNLTCDIACTYGIGSEILSQAMMSDCAGYPQLYLIDMETKQVIWRSCGWESGFTKEIGDIINAKK